MDELKDKVNNHEQKLRNKKDPGNDMMNEACATFDINQRASVKNTSKKTDSDKII